MIEEEALTNELLLSTIRELYAQRADYVETMNQSRQKNPIDTIIGLIEDAAQK